MITFHFHRTNTLTGILIRTLTRSRVNHVSVEINGYYYEALMGSGLVKRPAPSKGIIESVSINAPLLKEATEWADQQVGKKYDWLGVLSFVWLFLKERKGYWFCSEFAMVVLMKAFAFTRFNQKITPQDFLYLSAIIRDLNEKR